MAVFSDVDIRKIVNNKELVITPYNLSQLTGVGYDLSIGCIVDANSTELPESDNEKYRLESGHRYIFITKEYVSLSRSIMGTLHARGSLALEGLITSSTTVDPNFRGHMAMCIVNLSKNPIIIGINEPFITLVIHQLRTLTRLQLATTEDGQPRVAQRKIASIFPDETDVRRAKLNNYLTQQEQLEYFTNFNVITRADLRNNLVDIFGEKLRSILATKSTILIWITTIILLAIISICLYSVYDGNFIRRFFPNYNSGTSFSQVLSVIIASIAALIALHKKK